MRMIFAMLSVLDLIVIHADVLLKGGDPIERERSNTY